LNSSVVDSIRSAFEAEATGSSASVEFLSWQDEVTLVKLYLGKAAQLCRHFRFPEEVEATTLSYMKRFYIKNTVMDWHPKNVMLTTLFLATKTTNHPITLDIYASNIPKTSPEDVLELEFLVAQSLSFEFAVWHAHRALWGIYLDLQALQGQPIEPISQAYTDALPHVRASRLTDAELIYPPSQIALACLYLSSPPLAEQWLRTKCTEIEVGTIFQSIRQIATMIEQEGGLPDVEVVREIDRRLKLCKNPAKVVGSRAYLQKQAEEIAKANAKRARKAEESRSKSAANDPFGGDITMPSDTGGGSLPNLADDGD
jgi:cyclin H